MKNLPLTSVAAAPAPAAACCTLGVTPIGEAEADRLAPMFKALGDPVRLRMVSMIAAAPELCVCEITPAFDLSSATVSHHLKSLRDAGLVGSERRGTFVFYHLLPAAIEALAGLLGGHRPQPSHHP